MKAFILLLLIAMPTFSQKLWEIDVTGNGNLTDVREIPNSELLLFTYNTGRLEIRRGSDGSFVNQLISKPGESDGPVISSTGTLYYFRNTFATDTIEFRDIITNEPVIRISPIIEEYESNPIFDHRVYHRYNLFDNNTKLVGNIVYVDEDDSRNDESIRIIYNIVTRQIEYQRLFDVKSVDYYYSTIDKSYLSPDDKYFIETSGNYSRARIFNLQTRGYEVEFDGENNDEEKSKVDVLRNGRFQNDSIIIRTSSLSLKVYSFPEMQLKIDKNIWSKFHFFIGTYPLSLGLCENILTCNVNEEKENQTNQYYRYFVKIDLSTEQITYSSKNYQSSLDYCSVVVNDCSKLIIDRDFDNRLGVIACYDYSTLNVLPQNPGINYFSKLGSVINFNSSLFIGQNARIEIYDSVGNKVGNLYNGVINQASYQFQIPDLPSGAYYLQCQLPTQNLNFNFMVVI